MAYPSGPHGRDEYPDPETPASHQHQAVPHRSAPPHTEDEYPAPSIPPLHEQRAGPSRPGVHYSPAETGWSIRTDAVRKRAGQFGQQFSQSVSEHGAEWIASGRKYGADFSQRSAEHASEVTANAKEKYSGVDAKSKKQVLGRPAAVVLAQAILLGAALAAFFGATGASNRLFSVPNSMLNWVTEQDASFLADIDEGLTTTATNVQEGAMAAGQGLGILSLLIGVTVLLPYVLAVFGMWSRKPHARTVSCILAVFGVFLAFGVILPQAHVLLPFSSRGLFLLAAILGVTAMLLMFLPAANGWAQEKRGLQPATDYPDPISDAAALEPDQPVAASRKPTPPADY